MGNRMMDDIIHRMEGYNVVHMPHDKSMRCTLRDGKTGEMYTFTVRHGEVDLSQRADALLAHWLNLLAEQWSPST